jgi:hypothetical protein
MRRLGHRWEWTITCILFGAMLLVLLLAAVLQNPGSANLP